MTTIIPTTVTITTTKLGGKILTVVYNAGVTMTIESIDRVAKPLWQELKQAILTKEPYYLPLRNNPTSVSLIRYKNDVITFSIVEQEKVSIGVELTLSVAEFLPIIDKLT